MKEADDALGLERKLKAEVEEKLKETSDDLEARKEDIK